MSSRVVHFKKEPYDVYIGRPSKWGNPFDEDGTREERIQKYKDWVYTQPELIAEIKKELTGKVLGCWCKPKPCHGDIILEILGGINEDFDW